MSGRIKRRANGTGNISKLAGKRRKRWCARVRDDMKKNVSIGTFATKREAEEALDLYNAQKTLGTAPPPGALRVTIGECWEAWSARELADAGKSKRNNYMQAWKRRMEPYRDRQIRTMGVDDWQKIIDDDVAAGLSSGTVSFLASLIHAICRYAMERDFLVKDYSQFIRLPEHKPVKEKGALTHDQVAELVRLGEAGDPIADAAVFMCYTGFRLEETISLKPCDLDLAEWTLIGGEKTRAGKDRIVPVCSKVQPIVQRMLDKGGETIICKKDGTHYASRGFYHAFGVLMGKIGATNASPHWTRYTFNTLCHEAGVDLLTQKWLSGHSTEADITHHYTKATIQQLKDAVEKLWFPEV